MTVEPRPRPAGFGRRLAGWLLVALVTAACGGADGMSDNDNRDTRETAEAPVEATPTRLPPPAESNPFSGAGMAGDPAGDVDGAGDPPPGIDLTGARIVGSQEQLVMIWETSEKAEIRIADGSTARWTFELANGDQPVYAVTFQVAGKEWDILVLDRETGEESQHRIGSIYDDRLDVPYPAEKLTKLQPTFTWTAHSHYTDAAGSTWSDAVPDGESAAFPNEQE